MQPVYIKMVNFIKDNLKIIWEMEMALLNLMVINMKENGKMMKRMGKAK